MSSRFPSAPLGDLCEVTIGRQRSPKNHSGDHMVQYLRAANVKDGRLDLSNVMAMNFDPREQESYALRRGDVLVTEGCGSPAELGASARWNDDLTGTVCFQNTLLRLRACPGISDPSYLYLLARWCHSSGAWLTASSGTSILHIGHTRAKKIPVPVPTLDVQRKIGFVVSAYDDLIENNNRRIKLLEEMAQRIYREWFVDFRYPGHEAVPLVESELGSIPEGWCSRPLSSLAKVVMGQSPPSSAYNRDSEGKPFHQGVGTFGAHFPAHHVYSKSGARLAAKGDILMSVRAPVGRINVADRQMILGRGLSGISAQNAPFEFLLFSLRHFFREEDVMGNGSIFKSVTRRDVEDLPLPWPGDGLAQRFSDVVSPMWRHLHLLTKEQVILQSTRDLLLPRLVSGEIDVTDLDIVLAETAA